MQIAVFSSHAKAEADVALQACNNHFPGFYYLEEEPPPECFARRTTELITEFDDVQAKRTHRPIAFLFSWSKTPNGTRKLLAYHKIYGSIRATGADEPLTASIFLARVKHIWPNGEPK